MRFRKLIILVGALVLTASAASAAGCGESEPPTLAPTRTTVTIATDELLEMSVAAAVQAALTARDLDAELNASYAGADIFISSEPPVGDGIAGGAPYVRAYWVPVAALRTPLADVRLADLDGALVPSGLTPPARYWGFGVAAVPLPDFHGALDANALQIGLLPLDEVDASLRALSVDGVNIVFGEGDVASYRLVELGRVRLLPIEGDDEFVAKLAGIEEELAALLTLAPPDPITLRATGDIIPSRCVYAAQRDAGDFRHAFLEIGPWLAEADLTVGSLDASISDAGPPVGCEPTFNLLAPPETVEGLVYAGFDVLTVATNHVMDCGRSDCGSESLLDTLNILQSNGIAPVGGGVDLAAARDPAIVDVNGVRFAFLGYDEVAPYYHAGPETPGTAPLIEDSLREDVAIAAGIADVVVVLPQWGVEYTASPTFNQQVLAAAAVEAGASLVVGNHPHWVQAAEAIDGAFVAYALGNFVFDQDWSIETQQGVVLEAAFHGTRLVGVRYVPVRIGPAFQPAFAEAAEAAAILERIWTASGLLE